MKFKSETFLVFLLSAFVLVLFGCGSSGGGGGGGGGGTCVTPICNATTGTWSVDEYITQNGCDPSGTGYDGTYNFSVTQDGKNVTIVDSNGGTYSAKFCGDKMTGSASYDDSGSGGTITSNVTLTVDSGCTSFTGDSNWIWKYGYTSCSGTTSLAGTAVN